MSASRSNQQDCLHTQHGQCSRPHETNPFHAEHSRRWLGETAGVNQTHSPHGASALPSYAPSGCMDQPMQAQARLAMLIVPEHVPDFPCTLPRWLLPAAGRDGLGLVDGLLHRLHHTDSQQRGKATARCPPRLLGCRGGRAADSTEAGRARRRVLTLGVEGEGEC